MLVKVIGGFLVFVSCALIGWYYSLKEGFRINDLSELKRALLMLKNEIEFSHSPLPEALSGVALRLEPGLADFFNLVSLRLMEKKGEGASAVWSSALLEKLPNTYLQQEDLECLERLGETLGYLGRRMQTDGIDMTIMYIDDKTVRLKESEVKSRRLYKSVGVISGILITIVLL